MKNIFNLVKIKTRLLVVAVLMGVALIIMGIVSIQNTKNLSNTLEEINTSLLPALNNIQRVQNNLTKVDGLFVKAGLLVENDTLIEKKLLEEIDILSDQGSEENKERIKEIEKEIKVNKESGIKKLEEIREEINQLVEENNNVFIPVFEAELTTEQSRSRYTTFIENLESYRQLREEVFELAFEGQDEEATKMFYQTLEASGVVSQSLDELVDFTINASDSISGTGIEQADASINIFAILSIILFVLVVVILILVINSLTNPIEKMMEMLRQVEQGNLRVEVPSGYKAEFGEMFKSFRDMLRNLNALILGTKRTSENVRDSFADVKGEVEEISESITEMDSFLHLLAADMDNQVAGIKESSMAMDSIASGIQQIAESSTSVAELAAETSMQANDGSAVVEKSVTQIETINQVVEDTSSVVDRLVKRTKTIDEALKAITGIAEQTNLLALNASIEAARAGEQGRGFAVVADEVSKLAAQSKESANEINVLLQEINEDTKEAVRAMEQGKMESKQGIEVIQQAGQAFSSIVEQVTTMTEQVQEVSATVEEMSAGTEEVNNSLVDIVSSSEAISSQTMEAVQKNQNQVEVVNKIVDVMNEANEGVEKLEADLNEFQTENVNEINE